MDRIMVWAWAGLLLAAPTTTVGVGVAKLVAAHRASAYPVAMGRVETSNVERLRDDGTRIGDLTTYTYRPVVRYRFEVEGQSRIGTRATLLGESASEAWAAEITTRYPPGAIVGVHYDPDDPSIAYLEMAGGSTLPWVLIVMGGLPLAAWAVSVIRQRRKAA